MDARRRKVVITGANGFVGRQLISEILNKSSSDSIFNNVGEFYDTIVAIDICPLEKLSEYFGNSCRIVPLQLDLSQLLSFQVGAASHENLSTFALKELFFDVGCIIHTAAIVDTRENQATKDHLYKVNVEVTNKLVQLAHECQVPRFIHLSSASSCMQKNPEYHTSCFLRGCFGNSMFSSNHEMSSYGKSKQLSEERALQFYNVRTQNPLDITIDSTNNIATKVLVLRPHVVWGRGDPFATETMLQWNHQWYGSQPIIGDTDAMIVSIHVRSLVRYILLADLALQNPKSSLHGKVLNIGEKLQTLASLHRTILHTNGQGQYACMNELNHKFSNTLKNFMYSLPYWISVMIIWCVQLIDWLTCYSRRNSIYRVLTANSFAYTLKDFLLCPDYQQSFETDCYSLFAAALGNVKLDPSFDSEDELVHLFQRWFAMQKIDLGNTDFPIQYDNLSCLKEMTDYFQRLHPQEQYDLVSQHPISQSWSCGPIKLRNRVIKAATFESMCDLQDGVPTEQLVNYHAVGAKGGIGLTIVAYASVSFDGRSFPTQICLAQDLSNKYPRLQDIYNRTISMLQKLTEKVHEQGGKACIQITHAGAFNDPSTNLLSQESKRFQCPRGPSRIFNPLTMRFSKSLENDEATLQRIEDDFAHATHSCQLAGFDAVELHLGHGYLLSQFLSRRTNPMHAKSPQKRLSFPLRVLRRVVAVAHGEDTTFRQRETLSCARVRPMAVLVKFNVSELTEDDLPLSDCRIFANAFHKAGADLLIPSGGHVMVNGLHMLRGRAPVSEMADAQRNWFKSALIRCLGRFLIPTEPYHEAFFLQRTLNVCYGAGIPMDKVCLIGGVHDIPTLFRAVGGQKQNDSTHSDESQIDFQRIMATGYGFSAVQMGRVLLADPNFCLKKGIAGSKRDEIAQSIVKELDCESQRNIKSFACQEVNACDNGNGCIVNATMALKPLSCSKHPSHDWLFCSARTPAFRNPQESDFAMTMFLLSQLLWNTIAYLSSGAHCTRYNRKMSQVQYDHLKFFNNGSDNITNLNFVPPSTGNMTTTSSDGESAKRDFIRVVEFIKQLPVETKVSSVDILKALNINISNDVNLLESLKSNDKLEYGKDHDGSIFFRFRSKVIIRNKAELKQTLARSNFGILMSEIEDSYAGIRMDIMDMIRGGEIIGVENKEKKTLVLFSRGSQFYSTLSGTVTAKPGEQILASSEDLTNEIRRGEAILVGQFWYRVSSAVNVSTGQEQPQRARAPASVTMDKEMSDRNEYILPFSKDQLPLDGDFEDDTVFSGSVLKHGATNDIRKLWQDTSIDLDRFQGDDLQLVEELFQQKHILYGRSDLINAKTGRGSNRGRGRGRGGAVGRISKKFMATSGSNAHLQGSGIEKIAREVIQQQQLASLQK